MNRRRFLLCAAGWVGFAGPASAQTVAEQVVSQLRRQGYGSVKVSRTFLGRLRFVADGPAGRREIVLNPATGAILRDYVDRSTAVSGGGSGSDDRREDDDRDDDDRDEDDDRDDDDRDEDDDRDDDDRDEDDDRDDERDEDDDNSGPGGGDDD